MFPAGSALLELTEAHYTRAAQHRHKSQPAGATRLEAGTAQNSCWDELWPQGSKTLGKQTDCVAGGLTRSSGKGSSLSPSLSQRAARQPSPGQVPTQCGSEASFSWGFTDSLWMDPGVPQSLPRGRLITPVWSLSCLVVGEPGWVSTHLPASITPCLLYVKWLLNGDKFFFLQKSLWRLWELSLQCA